MPFLAHAGGLGITVVVGIMGLIGIAVLTFEKNVDWKTVLMWFAPLVAFFIWANIATVWSPYQAGSGMTHARAALLLGLILGFAPWALKPILAYKKHLMRHAIMATSLMAAGLLLIDVLTGWGLSILIDPVGEDESLGRRQSDALMNVGHGIYIYGQYAAPVIALFLTQIRKPLSWIAIIGFVITLGLAGHFNLLQIGPMSLGLVIITMFAAHFRPRQIVQSLMAAFAMSIIMAPVLAWGSSYINETGLFTLTGSWDHRLRMWAYCWHEIKGNPVIGDGFDAARTYQDTYETASGYKATIVSLHPHNIGIHIWLETGLVGATLFTAAILGLIKPALSYASTSLRASALSGVIISTLLLSATSISFWHDYTWAAFVFCLVILAFIPANDDDNLVSSGS